MNRSICSVKKCTPSQRVDDDCNRILVILDWLVTSPQFIKHLLPTSLLPTRCCAFHVNSGTWLYQIFARKIVAVTLPFIRQAAVQSPLLYQPNCYLPCRQNCGVFPVRICHTTAHSHAGRRRCCFVDATAMWWMKSPTCISSTIVTRHAKFVDHAIEFSDHWEVWWIPVAHN